MKKYMKQLFLLLAVLVFQNRLFAQPNVNCEYPQEFCSDTTLAYDYEDDGGCIYTPLEIWYFFYTANPLNAFNIICADGMNEYTIWGQYAAPLSNPCEVFTNNPPIEFTNSSPSTVYDVSSDVGGTLPPGYYYVRIRPVECSSTITFDDIESNFECGEGNCENCIGSFAPEPEKKYLLGAWVKEDQAALGITTYTNPQITLVFYDAVNTPTTLGPYVATGLIIDSWQRMEQEFTVPAGSIKMDIQLSCANGDCYFDDVRVFPYDGSMKSYVYDPVNLRLVAELDERNYATIYEYDEEGKLVRIKKETERGIMTIQESKSSTVKQ
jgi:YD repeat-containing protein